MSSQQHEKLKRARDAFGNHFRPQLQGLISNLAVGITKVDGKFALSVRCQFEDLGSVPKNTLKRIVAIVGTSFEHEGVVYPLDIKITNIPVLD